MKTLKSYLFLFFILSILYTGCKRDKPIDDQKTYGKIILTFSHKINGEPFVADSLMYTNAAGNQYMVNEIQYFISDVTLHYVDGSSYLVDEWNDIHYVDTDIPSTHSWNVADPIPTGNVASVSFIFGISEAKNISYMYANPPERDMFWPEFLGGGYHYMKLNGKWKDTTNQITPFDFHMGIGQIYRHDVIVVDSISGFVQNYFTVQLPGSTFAISKDQVVNLGIVMNIESWFATPHVWNWDLIGGYIMQNQAAMQKARENGADVFSVTVN